MARQEVEDQLGDREPVHRDLRRVCKMRRLEIRIRMRVMRKVVMTGAMVEGDGMRKFDMFPPMYFDLAGWTSLEGHVDMLGKQMGC